ncbi:hypothetical protein F511_36857 [Dorcoceras hygrometricum]|uniref:Uncharacterized protein n=1 Tax=Dorcoceras hygrometricum TaxID=472368 RepID=A0A2Z7B631_9LAMI|nr:hypothetical protein F511_36857 [Dorcoceras hygrometricum]
MVNMGQRSCACDWLCWYVATGTRRGKSCALFCVLRLDDQQLVFRIVHPRRRRLDKLVRRRFEDQWMVCLVSDFSVRSTGCPAFVFRNSIWLSSCERLFATVVSDWFCLAGVLRLDDQQLVFRIVHPRRRRLDKLVRRRFEDQWMVCLVSDFSVRSTGCPAFVFRNSIWLSSCERLFATVVSDWFCLAWLEFHQLLVLASAGLGIVSVDWFCRKTIIGFVFQSLLVLYIGRLGLRIVISFPILSKYFQPFVPYLSNPRTLFSRELFRRFPVVPVVVLARARLLPDSSGLLAGLVVAQYKDVRASGNTALSSPYWDRSHHEPSG